MKKNQKKKMFWAALALFLAALGALLQEKVPALRIGEESRVDISDKSNSQEKKYKVVKVIDGDTFTATDGNIKFKVRVVGMDAPEKKQAYGSIAKAYAQKRLLNAYVRILPVKPGLDLYSRVLAKVLVDEEDLALDMIAQGLASYYRPKCLDYPENKKYYSYDPRPYVAAEKRAREEQKNMWQSQWTQLPCEYRMTKK